MAYRIEFSQPLGLPFAAEFLLTDHATGLPVTIGDNEPEFSVFRGYGDYWPFFVANQTSGFLSVNRRYLPAFSTKDGIAFAKAVAAAGYATDPNYAGKLIDIIEAHRLQQFDGPIAAPIPREPAVAGPKPKAAPMAGAGAVVIAGGAGAVAAAQSGHVVLMWALFAAASVAVAAFLILHFRQKA